ncbi:Tagatose-6-phosphate kinase [Bienertia sinuspersici]
MMTVKVSMRILWLHLTMILTLMMDLYEMEKKRKLFCRASQKWRTPWQLFIDKQHLRDVVRDYCIQYGFSVIVEKANNSRYTIRCTDENYGWRLHAYRLQDGMTWAIKSIQNMEHCCIEKIRACNDISAKSLNKLLWGRFGLTMATSTLYKLLMGTTSCFLLYGPLLAQKTLKNWRFFIWHLKNVLKDSDRGDEWCIISDMHNGIENAISELRPSVGRRCCCNHLCGSWKRHVELTPSSPLAKQWNNCKKTNLETLIWLSKVGDQERWVKHAFNPVIKCDVNKTNFVESFNATLGIERCRHVISLLESVRRLTMVRMATRRQACQQWERGDMCPNIINRVKTLCYESRTCKALLSKEGEYEVLNGKSSLTVNLHNHTCLSNAWQVSKIPCKHGMRAILEDRQDPHQFVSEWNSLKLYN